jgi:ABC-type transporter Mla MlaB component
MFNRLKNFVTGHQASTKNGEALAPLAKELLEMQKMPEMPTQLRKNPAGIASGQGFRVNSPIGVDSKVLAKTAAARIDAIEREIALDLRGNLASKIGIHSRADDVARRNGINRIAPPKAVVLAAEVSRSNDQPYQNYQTVMPDMAHTLLLGDSNLTALIEVKENLIAPPIEEAAVLYANGQLDAAIAVLISAFKDDKSLGDSEFTAYSVLFDLLRYKGDSQRFDYYAIDFVKRFEKSAPSWHLSKQEVTLMADNIPTLDLGEMLDASIVPVLEQLKVFSHSHHRMRLSVSNINAINCNDGFGCELLMRVLTAFEGTEYELSLVGTDNLFTKLRPVIQSRQRHISGHVWILYLEMLRLQNQQLLFEDIALKFAMLYEVSPPSWRSPSKQLQENSLASNLAKTIMVFDRPDHIKLSGTIKSSNNELIKQIATGLHVNPVVVCDCSDLELIDFDSAGRLLTALTAWSAELKTVEFRNVASPIATLFIVLGIQHIAVVERRKDI